MGRLGGRAKAMVVTRSREHAVRLYQAIRAYADGASSLTARALVAFSGTLTLEDIRLHRAEAQRVLRAGASGSLRLCAGR